MVEVHYGRAVATPHLGSLQRSNASAGAEVERAGRCGFQTDRDISSAAADHYIATREVQGACAEIADIEIATIRPRAPAHAYRAVAAGLIPHEAIDTRHIPRAVDREAARAFNADNERVVIRPRAPAHAYRAVATKGITNVAITVRHTASAIDREATCALEANKETGIVHPISGAHDGGANAAVIVSQINKRINHIADTPAIEMEGAIISA